MKTFNEFLIEKNFQFDEAWSTKDKVIGSVYAGLAGMGLAAAGAAYNGISMDNKFQQYSVSNQTMSPEEWEKNAHKITPVKGMIPDPNRPGKWIKYHYPKDEPSNPGMNMYKWHRQLGTKGY
jgi:hypothetical protein